MERDKRIQQNDISRQEKPQGKQLDRLSTVVRNGGRYGAEVQYIGWDSEQNPMMTSNQNSLSPVVRESINTFSKARIPVARLSYDKITPVTYEFVGNILDFKDQNGVIAEDVFVFGVRDSEGNDTTIKMGEYSVLKAITSVKETMWQDMEVTERAIQASSSMYTLFIEDEAEGNDATAFLFKPTSLQRSNGPVFAAFLQEALVNLISLERLQPEEYRKGYLDAVKSLTSEVNKRSSKFGKFLNLFVEVEEGDVQRIKRDLSSLASRLKLFEVESASNSSVQPVFNINTMDLDTLLLLATRMRDAASNTLR